MNDFEHAAPSQTSYSFDEMGRLVALTCPGGGVTRVTYRNGYRKARLTDSRGQVHEISWLDERMLVVTIDPTTGSRTFGFEERRPGPPMDTVGRLTTFVFSSRVKSKSSEASDSAPANSEEDELRSCKTYCFDRRGRLVAFTGADGQSLRFEYDGDRRVVRIDDGRDETHEVPWEPERMLVVTLDPATGARSFAFEDHRPTLRSDGPPMPAATDPASPPIADSLRGIDTYTYDASGRLTGLDSSDSAQGD
jgi:YD repeat-containing protein